MPIQELSMSKRNYFWITVLFLALAVSATGLYRTPQTAHAPEATPTSTPTPTSALLGIKAYTDSPNTDYYGDCFRQEGARKRTLYLKAYAAFPVNLNTAKLV